MSPLGATSSVNMAAVMTLTVFAILSGTVQATNLAGTCGYPGSPAHGIVTFKPLVSSHQVSPGTVASYTCDNGYELLGPQHRVCNQNGTWTPLGIPFCGKFYHPIFAFAQQPILEGFSFFLKLSSIFFSTRTLLCDLP